ncbi:MAG: hypothetical protein ACFFG0_25575 [Candidatus Thorarchaeota archaeon]
MKKLKQNIKSPAIGERIKIYTISQIPDDFDNFLDKFSDNFVKGDFAIKIQGGDKLNVSRVKEKDNVNEDGITKEVKKEEKFEHGIKLKQKESYEKKRVKFKFQMANIEFYVKIEFEEVDSTMDVFYKYKVKGKGLVTKTIAKILSKGTGYLLMQGTIDAINKTL